MGKEGHQPRPPSGRGEGQGRGKLVANSSSGEAAPSSSLAPDAGGTSDLSIVIVSYNTRELLRRCLDSLLSTLAASGPEAEVFVVDNASSDESAAVVRSEYPQVRLIANPRNVGFAAANNQALGQVRGRYTLLLNPDTKVRGDALGVMVRFMEKHPQVGIVGAKLLYPDGSFQHSAFKFPTLAMAFLDFFPVHHRLLNSRLNGRYPIRCYEQPFPIDHPLGACLMVRREAMDEVGFLDERFFMYCEEIDWCMRVKSAGWEVWCVPEAAVIHYGGRSSAQFREESFVQLFRSRYALFAKHYSPSYQRAVRAIIRLGVVREMLKWRWRARRRLVSQEELAGRLRALGEVLNL